MLHLPLVAMVVVAQAQAPETTVYRDDQLRLSFTHPTTWKVEKRQKDITTLSLPIEGSTDRAKLEITRALYHYEPETWQTIQSATNQQLKREIVRQWQQEILGVPMLLTRIAYTDKGVPMSTLTGLLYTRSPQKMLFRLTGPTGDFDAIQFSFQQAIETLRTIDNSELKPEDPNRPPEAPPKKGEKPVDVRPPKKTTFEEKPTAAKPVAAPIVVDLVVSTRNMQIRLPQGWTADEIKDNTFVAHHPDLPNAVRVEVNSLLDSEPAKNALFKKSAESLALFKKVAKRSDAVDKATRAAMVQNAVWRNGEGEKGGLFALDAAVSNDTHYALVAYRSEDVTRFDAERRLLETLLDMLGVTPAP